jgi:hypothetical protein
MLRNQTHGNYEVSGMTVHRIPTTHNNEESMNTYAFTQYKRAGALVLMGLVAAVTGCSSSSPPLPTPPPAPPAAPHQFDHGDDRSESDADIRRHGVRRRWYL